MKCDSVAHSSDFCASSESSVTDRHNVDAREQPEEDRVFLRFSLKRPTQALREPDTEEDGATELPRTWKEASFSVAYILIFKTTFWELFEGITIGPIEFEAGLESALPHPQVEEILCRILGLLLNRTKPVNTQHYQRALSDAVQAHYKNDPSWSGEMDSIVGVKKFSDLSCAARLKLIHSLLDWALASSNTLRSFIDEAYKKRNLVKKAEENPFQVKPIGLDDKRQRYYFVSGSEELDFRLYVESEPKYYAKSKPIFCSVASTLEELRACCDRLSRHASTIRCRELVKLLVEYYIPLVEASSHRRQKMSAMKERNEAQKSKLAALAAQYTQELPTRTRGRKIDYSAFDHNEDEERDALCTHNLNSSGSSFKATTPTQVRKSKRGHVNYDSDYDPNEPVSASDTLQNTKLIVKLKMNSVQYYKSLRNVETTELDSYQGNIAIADGRQSLLDGGREMPENH